MRKALANFKKPSYNFRKGKVDSLYLFYKSKFSFFFRPKVQKKLNIFKVER